jgi:catechol 2,3-dioxygenase-like lactoylglutathione lyase family enzyme
MTASFPAAGRFHHVSLSVADLDAQQRWYQRALGLTEVVERFELPEPAVRTVVLRGASGLQVELVERAASLRPRPAGDPLETALIQGYGHWAVEVPDLDRAYASLTTAGGRPVWPPADAVAPGARFAYVADPEGNLLELIQPPPAGDSPRLSLAAQ